MSDSLKSNSVSVPKEKTCYLFIGAWAGSHGTASGLRSFKYDIEQQLLTGIGVFGEFQSMSCLVSDKDLLISCVESKKDDLIVSFRVGKDGALQKIDALHVKGFGIADLCIDTVHKRVFTSNFASGSLSMVSYDSEGKLVLEDVLTMPDPGSFVTGSSTLERQNASHPHCARMLPDGNHICVCDMGNDKLYILKVDFNAGKLIFRPERTVTVDSGEGPRHIVFSSDGKHAYMNTEMGCTIYTFAVNEDAALKKLQKLTTLQPGKGNQPKGWCSVTALSTDQKYAYVGNRGQNNIAGYKIGEDGRLTVIGFFDCYGVSPRGLGFGYHDEVLFCTCNTSGTISVIDFDRTSGMLGSCRQIINGIPGSANVIWGIYDP